MGSFLCLVAQSTTDLLQIGSAIAANNEPFLINEFEWDDCQCECDALRSHPGIESR